MSMAHEAEAKASTAPSLGIDGNSAVDLKAVVDSVFGDNFIKLKTVLDADQVVALSIALSFADEYDVDLIRSVALNLMATKVSQNGRGLKVLQTVLTSFLGKSEDPEDELKRFEKSVR